MELYNYLFNYVVITCKKFSIDESHALKHSMDVFFISNKIYEQELIKKPFLKDHKNIMDVSSILHDMCDKKYMNEMDGIKGIETYMKDVITESELDISLKIMKTMSYSTVKKNGYPILNEYQDIYNCVREADLLASYNFERCIIYQMLRNNDSYENSYNNAKDLFDNRVLKYIDDKLFLTDYAKDMAPKLHQNALIKIQNMNKIVKR